MDLHRSDRWYPLFTLSLQVNKCSTEDLQQILPHLSDDSRVKLLEADGLGEAQICEEVAGSIKGFGKCFMEDRKW